MPKDRLTVTAGEIRVLVGPPIETQDYSLKDRESLMKKVRETVSENFRLISQEGSGEKE